MATKKYSLAAFSLALAFIACSGDSSSGSSNSEQVVDSDIVSIENKTISGVSQKGPFLNGSSVTVQELNAHSLVQTGKSFEGKIKNDFGEFSVKIENLASQYVLLKANGFYQNEVTGQKSGAPVTLYALTDLSNRDQVNVNLLTHLEYERTLYLIENDSISVVDAKKQSEKEILKNFFISGDFATAEDLNIFGKGEGNAALLAISVLMQGDLKEADFSERLANYSADVESDGVWDDAKTATKIADWASKKYLNDELSVIRKNIAGWGYSDTVPVFEKLVNNFWWQNYGLGVCNENREGVVLRNENSLSAYHDSLFMCHDGEWSVLYYSPNDYKCEKQDTIHYANQTYYCNESHIWASNFNKCNVKKKTSDSQDFLVIIRDFSVTHPDFENFQEEAYYSINNGGNGNVGLFPDSWLSSYTNNTEWMNRRGDYSNYGCGNAYAPEYGIAISNNGYVHDVTSKNGEKPTIPDYIKNADASNGYAWFGEFKDCQYDAKLNPLSLKVMRGLVADLCSDASGVWTDNMRDKEKSCTKTCKTHSWSEIVYTTPGMVSQTLKFPPIGTVTKEIDMTQVSIELARNACDNGWFNQWYKDVAGVNYRVNSTLSLEKNESFNYYQVDYNYNNGGFFPLDSIDESDNYVGRKSCMFDDIGCEQFGPQTLSIYCPPYDYQWATTQMDYKGENTAELCKDWLSNGGPKSETAALETAANAGPFGLQHLRNYGFTMMGYAKFKYKPENQDPAHEYLQFAGNDDMWIYVDGVLAVDLGGTHLTAPGYIDVELLAQNNHGCHEGEPLANYSNCVQNTRSWQSGTWHHVHFFYANRQSSYSNFMLKSSIAELGAFLDCE